MKANIDNASKDFTNEAREVLPNRTRKFCLTEHKSLYSKKIINWIIIMMTVPACLDARVGLRGAT